MKIIHPVMFILLLATAAFTAGCQTSSVIPASNSVAGGANATSSPKLEKGCRIYVITPRDGSYGTIKYTGSGDTVASAFNGEFSKHAGEVIQGGYEDSNTAAIESAKAKGCDYVAIPKITHWEDRATEWSGKRDKMELFITIIRTKDAHEVAAAEISGKSRWMTFGGDHPQDLVKEPVEQFVSSLF